MLGAVERKTQRLLRSVVADLSPVWTRVTGVVGAEDAPVRQAQRSDALAHQAESNLCGLDIRSDLGKHFTIIRLS